MRFIWILSTALMFTGFASAALAQGSLPNKPHMHQPYVLLVSIDGFRWDYVEKHKPAYLSKFVQQGASVASLRPSYPTKTYPNHISIVTGLFPQHHGIVANYFFDRDLKATYKLADRSSVEDGRFYRSHSIWGLLEQQGIKTASYYWPGSESDNANYKPSYFLYYRHNRPHIERIQKINQWLSLPESKRPRFISLYFHEVDSAGHDYGPDSSQVKRAIYHVDSTLATIDKNLKALGLDVNIIIVSDHGMTTVDPDKQISLPPVLGYKAINNGAFVQYYRESGGQPLQQAIDTLETRPEKPLGYRCYDYRNTPKSFNIFKASRLGDIVCLAKQGWTLKADSVNSTKDYKPSLGNHGWSQFEGKDMHGIFFAKGPLFKTGYRGETVNNVDVFALLTKIYSLKITHPVDARLNGIQQVLKQP